MAKTSAPQAGVEALLDRGKARRDSDTKLPEGYAQGGVPGGRGGGMHVGRSGHTELRRMGMSSPSSMTPKGPPQKNGRTC